MAGIDDFTNSMIGVMGTAVTAGVVLKVTDAALGNVHKAAKKSSHVPKKHQETLKRVQDHDKKMRKAVFGK
jgi:hypothetical protein